MEIPEKQLFKDARKNTDQSLGAERAKTNRSVLQEKEFAEKHTNETVQSARTEADLETESARARIDLNRDSESPTKQDQQNDDRLLAERIRIDAAVDEERFRIDLAIDEERKKRNIIHTKLFEQERTLTDKNLKIERTQTDTLVLTASVQLSEEVAEHSKTRVSLTTRDEFLAIVSHDLRNPIGLISSSMEVLLEEFNERKIDSDTKNWIQLAKRNADTALRLINDLLDMERMAQDQLELKIEKADIGKVVNEALDNLVILAQAQDIELNLLSTEGFEIQCDRDRVLQILNNLIGNALKFTPKGGHINVKLEWEKENLRVSVSDTGGGIPDEKKNHIFEKFAQLKSANRTGLGLGLHISKMLVEAHHGKLWVESDFGVGSTFYFELPKAQLRPVPGPHSPQAMK